MPKIKLSSIRFGAIPFRKLKNLEIAIAPRLTVIAGHNGSGKSTILGLLANGSGLTAGENRSYFDRLYQANFQEIFALSPEYDFFDDLAEKPNAEIDYEINDLPLIKRCNTTKRNLPSGKSALRVVPRNEPKDHFESGDVSVGQDAKVPLPTIYLGMSRIIPLGESTPSDVVRSEDKTIDTTDATYIRRLINGIIETGAGTDTTITNQKIKRTLKTSKHPAYPYDSRAVSLGQDSLSSIVTALASFKKLKREMATNYPGGLLIIDEVEACFHPRTQIDLLNMLTKEARDLGLQIVVTTHSLTVIEKIYADQAAIKEPTGRGHDAVVYLMDSKNPYINPDLTFDDIKNDMHAELPQLLKAKAPAVKIYTEDDEALYVLKLILDLKSKRRIKAETGYSVDPISAKMGCTNLMSLYKQDGYFKTVVIVVDADSDLGSKRTPKNVIKLPEDTRNNPVTQSPERILHAYCLSLKDNPEKHIDAWNALKSNMVTPATIKAQFIDGTYDITERISAKKWFMALQPKFDYLKLYQLWIAEHREAVDAFIASIIVAIKSVNRTVAKTK